MTGVRVLCLGLFACLCLAASAPLVLADIAPGPSPSVNRHLPVPTDPPRRNGPFRSCGSGMGLGLAGIGVAWGLTWVGTRYAGRIAKTRQAEGRDGGNA